jgi:hypothetical protein
MGLVSIPKPIRTKGKPKGQSDVEVANLYLDLEAQTLMHPTSKIWKS